MASSLNNTSKQFHWINKDTDSGELSRSHGSEAASILRFVQKNRKVARQTRDITRRRTKNAHDFVAFETGTRGTLHHFHDNARDGTATRSNMFRAAQSRWRLTIPINNLIEGSSVDPFAAAAVPFNSNMFSLLQYAKSSITNGAGGYKLEVIAVELRPMTDIYQAATDYVFQNVVKHKHIIYPVLAAFTRRMRTLNDSSFSSLQNPDFYLHLATQAVRLSIAEHASNHEALSHIATGVHYLVCSTGLAGRYEESRVHTQAFLKFLPYVNTKSPVGYWELDVVSTLDLANSIATGREPVIRIATCDPGPLMPSRRSMIHDKLASLQSSEYQLTLLMRRSSVVDAYRNRINNRSFDMMLSPTQDLELGLGSALDDAIVTDRIHSSIAPTVSKLLECLMVAKIVWRAPEFVTKKDTQWLCQRAKAILHELLSLDGPRKVPTTTFAGQQAECLRLTLLIVMTSVNYRILHLSRKEQAIRLRAALSKLAHNGNFAYSSTSTMGARTAEHGRLVGAELDRTTNESLLWMLFIGYWAAGEGADALWFAEAIVGIATTLVIRNFNGLEEVMLRYLYGRTAQQGSLMDIGAMVSGQVLTL